MSRRTNTRRRDCLASWAPACSGSTRGGWLICPRCETPITGRTLLASGGRLTETPGPRCEAHDAGASPVRRIARYEVSFFAKTATTTFCRCSGASISAHRTPNPTAVRHAPKLEEPLAIAPTPGASRRVGAGPAPTRAAVLHARVWRELLKLFRLRAPGTGFRCFAVHPRISCVAYHDREVFSFRRPEVARLQATCSGPV